jgi:hypothetical protein
MLPFNVKRVPSPIWGGLGWGVWNDPNKSGREVKVVMIFKQRGHLGRKTALKIVGCSQLREFRRFLSLSIGNFAHWGTFPCVSGRLSPQLY